MKQLTLVRHGKADPGGADRKDFDRPLNRRGLEEAVEMAQRLAAAQVRPDAMLSSPALRAVETARIFVTTLAFPLRHLKSEARLYLASPAEILAVIRHGSSKAGHVLLFGHNPGLSDFARALSGNQELGELPTAAVCALELDIEVWSEAAPGVAAKISVQQP